MSITYPLATPTIIYPSGVTMTMAHANSSSQSPFTRQTQVYDWGASAWAASLTFPSLTQEEADEWVCFLLKLRGRVGTFLLGDPSRYQPRGIATGVPLINGAAQTGYSLITDGWSHSVSQILAAGDYIQIGTGASSRLHKVTSDATSDSSGNATLEITPKLRYSPADNDPIIISETVGVFRNSSPNISWNAKNMLEYGFSFDCEEVLDVS